MATAFGPMNEIVIVSPAVAVPKTDTAVSLWITIPLVKSLESCTAASISEPLSLFTIPSACKIANPNWFRLCHKKNTASPSLRTEEASSLFTRTFFPRLPVRRAGYRPQLRKGDAPNELCTFPGGPHQPRSPTRGPPGLQ